jgi:SAM-dependent methyltransferase
MPNTSTIRCPVCNAQSHELYQLSSSRIKASLSEYYLKPIPNSVSILDSSLYRCSRCTLEHCHPFLGGDSSFYEWITKMPDYYPTNRWEWEVVRTRLQNANRRISILEIGCGDGSFLSTLQPLQNIRAVGLDTTLSSVQICREKGLEVYNEDIIQYAASQRTHQNRFDFIVAFHCLEHVDNPVELITASSLLLEQGGRILFSTPFSPMSFESLWFDPLNHPPHHTTRWNLKSYTELGSQTKLNVDFEMPKAPPLHVRLAIALNFYFNGKQNPQRTRVVLLRAFLRPYLLATELFRQIFRARVNGKTAADVILVDFH